MAWLTGLILLETDTFSQNVAIVTAAVIGALVAPDLIGVASWF